jgi:hypothetical protein
VCSIPIIKSEDNSCTEDREKDRGTKKTIMRRFIIYTLKRNYYDNTIKKSQMVWEKWYALERWEIHTKVWSKNFLGVSSKPWKFLNICYHCCSSCRWPLLQNSNWKFCHFMPLSKATKILERRIICKKWLWKKNAQRGFKQGWASFTLRYHMT